MTLLALALSIVGLGSGLDTAAPARGRADEEAQARLDAMVRAAREAPGLRVRCRVVETDSRGRRYPMTSVLAWDPARNRLMAERGYQDAPGPHRSILVAGDECITVDHLLGRRSVYRRAEDRAEWSLEDRLALAAVDELWKIAFTGKLHETARAAAGAPAVLVDEESIDGRPCDRIDWDGSGCRIWLDRRDHLPRRFEGWKLSGGSRAKEHLRIDVQWLDTVAIPENAASFELPTGLPTDSPQEAAETWGELRRSLRDRLDVGRPLPDFEAKDAKGRRRSVRELDGACLLIFWFSPSEEIEREVLEAAAKLAGRDDLPHLIAVHHGKLPSDLDRFVGASRLELWASSVDSEGAHRRCGVYRCPRFVLVDDDGLVQASTRSLEEMRKHLDG